MVSSHCQFVNKALEELEKGRLYLELEIVNLKKGPTTCSKSESESSKAEIGCYYGHKWENNEEIIQALLQEDTDINVHIGEITDELEEVKKNLRPVLV